MRMRRGPALEKPVGLLQALDDLLGECHLVGLAFEPLAAFAADLFGILHQGVNIELQAGV